MKKALVIAFKYYQHFGPVKKNPHRDHVLFLMYPALLCFRRVQWERDPLPEFDMEMYTNPLENIDLKINYSQKTLEIGQKEKKQNNTDLLPRSNECDLW